jgi:hypothetical protein
MINIEEDMNRMSCIVAGTVLIALLTPVTGQAKQDKDSQEHKEKGLPPGLQKKLQRGEPLPPGWQKKLHKGDVLDAHIYARGRVIGPVDGRGVISIRVEDTLIKLDEKTRKILDIISILAQ